MNGYLLLADGTFFEGTLIGDVKNALGEVVFNTGMTGYQEILTDPSYYKQIVVMAYPLIGNYGINAIDFQAEKPHVSGFVVSSLSEDYSNASSHMGLDAYLKAQGICCLTGVDTRALIKKIRTCGAIAGKIITDIDSVDFHLDDLKASHFYGLANEVSVSQAKILQEGYPKIALIDFGVKQGIIDNLLKEGCGVKIFNSRTLPGQIEAYGPDALLLSNGPGNPQDMLEAIYCVRYFRDHLPIYGICLGHQIIALATGASTEKLKFGHRGTNHPVKNLLSGRIAITSQNHSYTVIEDSIPPHMMVTHVNLSDGTVEGLMHKHLPIASVQFHPEAYPGPRDANHFFKDMIAQVKQVLEGQAC